MTLEKQLINKSYYQTFMEGNEKVHPIRVLGEMYVAEQQNEVPDLTYIRFAQGEVYFLNKDYEAAIFKWENIPNELGPWAQKNMADAYFELDLLSNAEDFYKAIETESDVLKTEVLLQLFSLYIQRGKLEMAVDSIKNAVHLNPDYPDVTDMARGFFEEHSDWGNAVELAVNEAIRTESLSWFEVLHSYVEQGRTAKIEPNYFSEALVTLFKTDEAHFESLSAAMWNSYKQNDLYFSWLKEFNHLLLNIEPGRSHTWQQLSELYKDTYFELINGKHLIRDLSHLIPNHLSNWIKIAAPSHTLVSAAAVLAWSEIFPSNIDASAVSEAESLVSQSVRYQDGMEEGFKLFETVMKWAKEKGVLMGERFEWMVRELLDLDSNHLLIAGSASNGKSSFVNTLLGEELMGDATSASVLFKDADEAEIHAITDEDVRSISDLEDFRQSAEKSQHTLIHCKMPVSFLQENRLALIDTPGLAGQSKFRNGAFQYLHLADSMLFVLNADSPLTDKELDMVVRMREQAPELPIHFLLSKMDRVPNSQDAMELVEETASRINTYFPKAKVFAFSTHYESQSQLKELSAFIRSMMDGRKLKEERTAKVLYYIKKSIKFLLEKRVEMENSLIDTIKWNEEMVTKLTGAINQLSDMEEEKVRTIKKSYSKIKDEMRQDLKKKIPELLRNSSELVTEDSDFGKIHDELNDEMNKRIHEYIEETVLPDFHVSIQDWIAESEGEFKDSQAYLNEMSESFNELYGEEKVTLDCDFKVLDDWRRDADRMTRGSVQLEKVNILNRFSPSQFLLKSAGKLLGAIPQNKGMLHNKYKQYIENEDYSEIAESITDKFMQQFELFEKSLERDIKMFFRNPFDVLNKTVEETHEEIEENKQSLSDMRKNPEIYRDPLTLFELKLRQFEWMTTAGERVKEYR
ncbi:dynamin family protein [Aeromicrobium ponti]|uniref:GTPase Era involved in 16S rRNA processing n=1 Tax=Cytobacillus oceanisediminis TaxID=665099 RepID=A0A562JLG3_9BACI|nr:dynamin family protein [Cytobacillus oceanisediminis]TWH84057.1 GTPase Era involved in 16S rRNA processing [Cytobacillus oceanisediminis]